MKRIVLLWVPIFLLFSSSCKKILLITEGIKQPGIENHQSLSKFLIARGIDTSEMLCFRDTQALNNFYRAGIGFPEAQFFNRDKKFVDYRESVTDCNGMVSVFLDKVDSINLEIPVEGKMLDDYLKGVVVEKTGKAFVLEDQDYEVYMIAYWAKFLGKMNKRKIYDWQERVKKANQNGKKVRMILVSTDYQKFWGISKDQIPKFEF